MSNKTTVISQEQLQQQLSFCHKIQSYWHDRDRVPTAYVETYGCQQNEADSEKIRGLLSESGYFIKGKDMEEIIAIYDGLCGRM